MLIIKILGGLGNQMFQYAFYKALIEKGYSVKADISDFEGYSLHNGYELKKVFDINIKQSTISENYKVGKLKSKIDKYLLKWGLKKNYYADFLPIDAITYHPEVFNIKSDMYLWGYWQSYKYFEDIKTKILSDFIFNECLDEKNKMIMEMISNTNSVSLHIRRGDYVDNKIVENICTNIYYKNAVEYIMKNVQNPKFFIFSNDIEWCKEKFLLDNVVYVDNSGENSYKDMQLMSKCKHNIIANSTFSWWGAYLNQNADKIVICPNKWFNISAYHMDDIYPEDWIKMKIE